MELSGPAVVFQQLGVVCVVDFEWVVVRIVFDVVVSEVEVVEVGEVL